MSQQQQHLAAVLHTVGQPLSLEQRLTPARPSPKELLIRARSIALNPIDYYQRDFGFALSNFPAVVGSDVAGTVIAAGSDVPADSPFRQPGARVTAFAPCFFVKGDPDYGALQEVVRVPAANACVLPEDISFRQGSVLPMAVGTALSGWHVMDLARDEKVVPEGSKGMLVWGGASSVGSAAVQSATLMGFRVYAVASGKHHDYIEQLGAARVFDYKGGADPVGEIVKAAKGDGVTIAHAYDAVGSLQQVLDVLTQAKGGQDVIAKVASAPPVNDQSPKADKVDVKFVEAPTDSPQKIEEFFGYVFNGWLNGRLSKREFVPSPGIKVIDGGLVKVNEALDELKGGVSGVKLVMEV
ncbi:MAG: hypothetical protein M1831_001348 [Alyxoria varia]|nr:MAG: hypothetical protein M1831_001348 [Alyxoria varia]